jgi:hypothetical protein
MGYNIIVISLFYILPYPTILFVLFYIIISYLIISTLIKSLIKTLYHLLIITLLH